jgi:hypothetical protein
MTFVFSLLNFVILNSGEGIWIFILCDEEIW